MFNWIDISIIFLFTSYLIVKETVPVIDKKTVKHPELLVVILVFFRFCLYAIPLYVTDIFFVSFIINVLNGNPFINNLSLFTTILRLSIVFGIFGLAQIIYPRITSEYLKSIPAKLPSYQDTIFYNLLTKTLYKPLLVLAIYACLLLVLVIPFTLYALSMDL